MHAMSVDLEEYFCDSFHLHLYKPHTKEEDALAEDLEFRVDELVPRILDLFAESGTRATFFVLGYVARHRPNLVKRIHAAGHEIGIHGYSHLTVPEMDRKGFIEDLDRAISQVQETTGSEVLWYRSPDFSIQQDNLWALDILYEKGIRYDSSILPTISLNGGASRFPNQPCLIRFNGCELVEFPVCPIPFGPLKIPLITGGGYFRLAPYPFVKSGIQALEKGERVSVFYFHPYDIDKVRPRIDVPMSPLYRFKLYVRRGTAEERLGKLLGDFQWSTMGEMLKNFDIQPAEKIPTLVLNDRYEIIPLSRVQ